MEELKSTVGFKSNLQLFNGSYFEDKEFRDSIHDPFALEAIKNNVQFRHVSLTSLQEEEYHKVSLHCNGAEKGDFPFGTIINPVTKKKEVVCKCLKIDCPRFQECRPNFSEEELDVLKENKAWKEKSEKRKNIVWGASAFHGDTSVNMNMVDVDLTSPDTEEMEPQDNSSEVKEIQEVPIEQAVVLQSEEVLEDTVQDEIPTTIPGFSSFRDAKQQEIIEMPMMERTVVNAGPGTGKTWSLIQKIQYMLNQIGEDPEDLEDNNILVLCFSRAAVDVVRKRLQKAADEGTLPYTWREIDVRTFDSFATYLLSWAVENEPSLLPRNYTLEGQSYDKRIRTATDVIDRFDDMLAQYAHVIVDEVQDLVGVRAEMVLGMLRKLPDRCGFTLLGDSCQSLYDYLSVKDSSIMSSGAFYDAIFHEFPQAHYLVLNHNYRQNDDFEAITGKYRQSILMGDANARKGEEKKISDRLDVADIDLRHAGLEDIEPYLKQGTVAILTRTNGQALQISSRLLSNEVPHTLLQLGEEHSLGAWIAKILLQAPTEVMDEHIFSELFQKTYPAQKDQTKKYWEALRETLQDETQTHIEIEDLLKAILKNGRSSLLYTEPDLPDSKLIVSNVHRVKGKEFDTVWILDDILQGEEDDVDNELLNHKVCYVALTRARRRIQKLHMNESKGIRNLKDDSRRCYKFGYSHRKKFCKTKQKAKPYLNKLEIGVQGDFDDRSCAVSEDRQKALLRVETGASMELRKLGSQQGVVYYKLVQQDKPKEILAITGNGFSWSERKIFIEALHFAKVKTEYFHDWQDVYFSGLKTCISGIGRKLDGAKQFGSMYIWYGIKAKGFASLIKDRY